MQSPIEIPVEPSLLTIPQAAMYLGAASEWAVRRLIYAGQLPYIKVGKRFNLRKADLDAWIEKNLQREAA
jgi:excisionase family DNA binding protein